MREMIFWQMNYDVQVMKNNFTKEFRSSR